MPPSMCRLYREGVYETRRVMTVTKVKFALSNKCISDTESRGAMD